MRLRIVGIGLALAGCTPALDANNPALTSDPRDRDVWRAFLASHVSSGDRGIPWAFALETIPASELQHLLPDSVEAQAVVFVEDVALRNQQPVRLPFADLKHPTEDIVWIGPAELPTPGRGAQRWQALSKLPRPVSRIWRVTRPAYDSTRTRAYIIQMSLCAPEAILCERRPITLELRLMDGRWIPWRLQTLPPDSMLSHPRVNIDVD